MRELLRKLPYRWRSRFRQSVFGYWVRADQVDAVSARRPQMYEMDGTPSTTLHWAAGQMTAAADAAEREEWLYEDYYDLLIAMARAFGRLAETSLDASGEAEDKLGHALFDLGHQANTCAVRLRLEGVE